MTVQGAQHNVVMTEENSRGSQWGRDLIVISWQLLSVWLKIVKEPPDSVE